MWQYQMKRTRIERRLKLCFTQSILLMRRFPSSFFFFFCAFNDAIRFKHFILLHPTSSLSGQANALPPSDILFYVTLLETNKPYLTNVLVCPALQALLLSAQLSTLCNLQFRLSCSFQSPNTDTDPLTPPAVDVSTDCSRLIVDNWLEIRLQGGPAAERLLEITHQLRMMLGCALQKKLASSNCKV
jgi:hypothetical protein